MPVFNNAQNRSSKLQCPYVQKEKEKIKKSDLSGLKALFI